MSNDGKVNPEKVEKHVSFEPREQTFQLHQYVPDASDTHTLSNDDELGLLHSNGAIMVDDIESGEIIDDQFYPKRSGCFDAFCPSTRMGRLFLGIFGSGLLLVILLYISARSNSKNLDYFPQITILISLDGFRSSYFDEINTPNLHEIARYGVRAGRMIPRFPTKTFPNHYSMVTGLYPESHGIVSNKFFDPNFNETFTLSDPSCNTDGKWWDAGEPIWITAEKQNVTSYTLFWPGSEAEIGGYRPSYYLSYGQHSEINNEKRIDMVLDWLDPKTKHNPQLIAAYFSTVDEIGHKYGPDSKQIKDSVRKVDKLMKRLFDGIEKKNLWEKVNLVIVSDHGMSQVKEYVQYDSWFNKSEIEFMAGSPVVTIRVLNDSKTDEIYEQAQQGAINDSVLGTKCNIYKKGEIPEKYNYRNNDRISQLMILAEPGIELTRSDFKWFLKGNHGFDNEIQDMGALFIARGPLFKPNYFIDSFSNLEIYGLLSRLLNITAAPNNGTLQRYEFLTE